jgi:Plasmid encoded RepA protein
LERAGDFLRKHHQDLFVSKHGQAESVRMVRLKRETRCQTLGYASRPFVLCGLPVKRPPAGTLIHERRNGRFLLQVTGHPHYGLPWGQDRLVPIFLATLATRQQSATVRFPSAAEMLDTFGIGQGGTQYRRLVAAFERIFGATIFFGTDSQVNTAAIFQQVRFNFLSEARLWYWRNSGQQALPEVGENVVVLSPEFYREITTHPIPTDLQAARALSGSPAALDLYNWISYRCHIAKREERVPLFGAFGLSAQLGMAEYARPRKFRERLEHWLGLVNLMWPECPAHLNNDGKWLIIRPASAIISRV